MDPKSSDWYLYKRKEREILKVIQKRKLHEDENRGRDWSGGSVSQRTLRTDGHRRERGERHRTVLPQSAQKEPALPTSLFQASSLLN